MSDSVVDQNTHGHCREEEGVLLVNERVLSVIVTLVSVPMVWVCLVIYSKMAAGTVC